MPFSLSTGPRLYPYCCLPNYPLKPLTNSAYCPLCCKEYDKESIRAAFDEQKREQELLRNGS